MRIMPVNENVYRWALLAILALGLVVSRYFRGKADRAAGRVARRGDGLPVMIGLIVGGVGAMGGVLAYLVNPRWMEWSQLELPPWLRLLGIPMGVAAVGLFAWVFRFLGANVTPTAQTREGHTLVTDGPYRWVRHPMYTSGIVLFGAYFLLTANWFIVGMCLVAFAVLVARCATEEANLIERFGDEYRAYMQRTGRFIPRRDPG